MSRPIRRSQAISPFGIGAMVDFPGPVSLIHGGMDAWPFDEKNPDHREFRIEDEKRLSRRLKVEYFVQPPDYRISGFESDATRPNLNLQLPFLRFPLWHSCPRCGRMFKSKYHHKDAPICIGPIGSGSGKGQPHPRRKTVQVRFVAACKHGHLQDFPWAEWIFKDAMPAWTPDDNARWLRMRTSGSASLAGVEVIAEEASGSDIVVVGRRTLGGAFSGNPNGDGSDTALSGVGVFCEGHNPSLGIGTGTPLPGCGQALFLLLRGSSNVYFPQVVSSIYIPDIDDQGLDPALLELLDDPYIKKALMQSALSSESGLITRKSAKFAIQTHRPDTVVDPEKLAEAGNRHVLKDILLGNIHIRSFLSQKIKISDDHRLTKCMVETAINNYFREWEIDASVLLAPIEEYFRKNSLEQDSEIVPSQNQIVEVEYRREEYEVFCRDIQEGYPKTNLLIRSTKIEEYEGFVGDYFERISLLHKLRETRAFVGYSRIFPESDISWEDRWKLISKEKKNWLPAILVRGEGIFLKVREDRISDWMNEFGEFQLTRMVGVNSNIRSLRERRHQPPKVVSPKFALLHTFAHLLINQLVYDCGYGSASLRERIYSSDGENPMSGVLIYTAAGDSEGTMGGLVRMGQKGYLEDVIAKALEKARWCSTDPVCIESRGQGPDNCNMAACHSCALLPETSCEEQNRMLDRGVVIGTLQRPEAGFFSRVISGIGM